MNNSKTKAVLDSILMLDKPLGTLLPQRPVTAHLSQDLLNSIKGELKSPRDYYLPAFCSLYELAYPAMLAGLEDVEAIDILGYRERRNQLLGFRNDLRPLSNAIQDDNLKSLFLTGLNYQDVVMANAFLKTSANDEYSVLMMNLLKELKDSNKLAIDDFDILKNILATVENEFKEQELCLNCIPDFSSRQIWKLEQEKEIPRGVPFDQIPVQTVDNRKFTLDKVVPILKDLILRHEQKKIDRNSIGLGAFLPLLKSLDMNGYLGLIMEVSHGSLKSVRLVKYINNESRPPVYGPMRSMLVAMLDKNAGTEITKSLAEQSLKKEDTRFFSTSVLGGINTFKNPNDGLNENENNDFGDVSLAGETFVFREILQEAYTLDPIGVLHKDLSDKIKSFEQNRLCFYGFEFNKLSPHINNAIVYGNKSNPNTSACLDEQSKIASKIINESYELITGNNGNDKIAKTKKRAFNILKIKYELQGSEDVFLLEEITGKNGYRSGAPSEIYALFFQKEFSKSPISFKLMLNSALLMSKVTFGPQFK